MAFPLIGLALGGFLGHKMMSASAKKEAKVSGRLDKLEAEKTVDVGEQTAQQKMAAEQQAEQAKGEKSSKQAAAFLKSRNAEGFGSNPNVAKPFLLSL